jgi:PAS domain S-box-containing protein
MLKTARICGAVAAGFGILALFGWVLGVPFLAGFGSDKIPMAPSTGLLFALYGLAVLLCARSPLGRGAYRAGVAVTAAGALVALLLLTLASLGIRPAAELLGFAAAGTVDGAPVGHMSPVTAVGFLLASLSFLGSLPSSSSRRWRADAAWWTASLLLATWCGLLLAYVYGAPLFYGGSFIPPAATTSIAFVALGTALLALAGRQARPSAGTTAPPARVPYRLVLIFVLLGAGIATVGAVYLRSEGRRYRAGVEHQISAVAELKTRELVQWRAERVADAAVLRDNTAFSSLVRRVFDSPRDAAARDQLRHWLGDLQRHALYDRVSVLDARGVERLAVPDGGAVTPVSSVIARRVPEVLRAGKVVFEDFYRNEHDGRVYLGVLSRILDEQNRALGIVALRIDPETYLYPLIKRWPVPTQTAETLLVRRDGDDALFLNELKFLKHTALTLRLPLARQDVAAVKAVLGREGVVDTRDYRGVPVLAALRAVPGSPWFLVARLDAAEVNGPLRERLWVMLVLVGSLLAAAAAGVGLVWRAQRERDFRDRYEAEQERAWLHDVVARSLNEVYVFDPETLRFRFVNLGACRNIGFTQEELAGRTPLDIKPEFTAETFRAMLEPLRGAERPTHAFETLHRRKDGSKYPVEVHLQLVDSGAGAVFLAVINDITERRRAETRIRRLNRVYAVLSDVNQAIVRVREPQALFAETCRIAVETGGFRMAWVGLLDAEANSVRPVAHAGVTDGYLDELQIDSGDGPRGLGPAASVLRDGVHAIFNDIEHDPQAAAWRDAALAHGYRASAVFPLTVNGETLGTFALYASEPAFFDSEELQLLDEMVADLSFAMEFGRLEETRLRLATAIHQLPVSVMITDLEGRIEFVNPAFTRITGYAPEEALGRNPRMLKSGRQEPALYQELWATIRAGRDWSGELVNRRKDGSLYTQDLTITPIRDAVGTVTHFIAIGQDVTERKRAAAELRASDVRYRAIAQTATDAMVTADAAGNVVGWNLAAEHVFGYTEAEVNGQPLTLLMPQRYQEGHLSGMNRLRAGGEHRIIGSRVELTGRRKDATEFPLELSLARWEGVEGWFVTGIARDITERKRVEEALLKEKAFSEAMLDSLPGIFCLFDRTGRLLRWNHAVETILGYSAEETAAMRAFDFFAAKDRAMVEEKMREVFETGAAAAEASLASKDGKRTPYYFIGSRIAVDGVPCCLAMGVDITAQKQLEGQLRQSQKLEGIGQLAGGIAHDFNNLLTVILGRGALLRTRLGPGHPGYRDVELIEQTGARAAEMTRQLLAFSRKQLLQPELLDLNTVITGILPILRRLVRENIEVVVRPGLGLGSVRADRTQVEQILLNLAANGSDAMPRGGRLTIETADVELDKASHLRDFDLPPGAYVVLTVSDTGIGMDAVTRARIFEPFFTTKEPGKGTGLGLATVYGVVKQSGGYIAVASDPGHGTTFTISLPRAAAAPAAVAARPTSTVLSRGTGTILLAEDADDLRDLIRDVLETHGYTVLVARHGGEALQVAGRHPAPIHLLVTDAVMPQMDGSELAERLRSERPGLKILYVSGYIDDPIVRRDVLESGAPFLQKPFMPEALVRKVREVLDGSR